ncbi:MAG: PAS domain S-box protein [Nitrospirae bacterium]|nr:PAS domain S-box protein [Nitrospirota bacterium]
MKKCSSVLCSRWYHYLLAFALVVGMLIVRFNLPVGFGERPILILFILPVIISALIGGLGPGIVATILAAALTGYNMPPAGKLEIRSGYDLFQWIMLIIDGLIVSIISEWLHSMRHKESSRRLQIETANAALQVSEEKYRNLIDNIPERIFVKDKDLAYLSCNEHYAADLGIQTTDICGKTDHDFYPADLAEKYRADDVRVMESGHTMSFEENYKLLGRDTWIYTIKTPIIDKNGNIAGILGIFSDITEKKQADEIIRAREKYLQAILHTTAEGFWVINSQGLVTEVNDAYCFMSGYTKDEIIGMRIKDLDADEDPADTAARIKRVITNSSELFEVRHKRKDGSIWPLEVSATWLNEYGGQIICFCHDLTEQKKAQQELTHSHNLMRYIIDHTNSSVAVHDKELKYIYASQRYLNAYKINGINVIGKHHYEIFPDLPQKWRDVHQRALAGEVLKSDRDSYVRDDGSVEWTRWECRPWYEADNSVGGIIVYTEVITDWVLAEEALRKSEKHLTALIAASPLAIISVDLEGNVKSWNSAAERIFGWTQNEVIGKMLPIVPKDKAYEFDKFRNRIINGAVYTDLELKRQSKDGRLIDISISTAPIHDKNGEIAEIIALVTDITDRKKIEAERIKLQDQLMQAQKMESVGRLAGGVAHDFNNKLGVILGYTELALSKIEHDNTITDYLKQISTAAQRSAEITRQLLAFARKQTISPRALILNDTIDGMINMLQRLIGENIDLSWLPGKDTWYVMMDPAQLDQILVNLCVNARDAISGTGKITIETANSVIDKEFCSDKPEFIPGDFVTLTVSDNGCGMDKDTITNLFEPFFTTKDVGKGTGLGLATVYGIIKQNNGFINVYSEPGQGSMFRIYLPAYKTAAENTDDECSKNTKPAAGHEKILLVEDEPSILEMTKTMLEMLGYTVLAADSPAKALNLAETHDGNIDLLMTDVIMPEMNGDALAKQIKAIHPKLKLLFMSGYTADVIGHHGVLDVEVYFIQKPFSIKDLALKIRQAIED